MRLLLHRLSLLSVFGFRIVLPGDTLANGTGPRAAYPESFTELSFPRSNTGVGRAIVVNNCARPFYLWSVGNSTIRVQKLRAHGGRYSEPVVGSKSIKIHQSYNGGVVPPCDPFLWSCRLTQFEYNLSRDHKKVYYDISWVNCAKNNSAADCPGHAGGVSVECSRTTDSDCPPRKCPAAGFCPHQVYYDCGALCNTDDPTEATTFSQDLKFTLCTDNDGSGGEIYGDDDVDRAVPSD